MEFRQLEAFKLIADTGSFSKAAKQMGVSQPSVSTQINTLEREFGCPLLSRQPGKAFPTEAGLALYSYASEILSLRNKAISSFAQHQEMSKTVSIAASSIPYQFLLPVLTAQFTMKYPDAQFNLVGSDSASAANLVLTGKFDLGMVGTMPLNNQLLAEPILEDELMLVVPASLPYTQWKNKTATIQSILGLPFVAREEGSGTWIEVEHYLEQQGFSSGSLHIVARMDNPDAIIKAVEQGLGITILSSLAASEYLRKGKILAFSLAGNPVKRKIYLIRNKEKTLPLVAEAFASFIFHRTGTTL